MKNLYPHLLSPLKVGPLTYRNRVVSAPRGGIWNEDPDCADADPEQLTDADLKCGGGVAAYCIGETAVSPSGARGANEFYGFADRSEEHVRRYRQYAEHIHSHGAAALVELSHMGLFKPESTPDAPALGPSDGVNDAGVPYRGMTEEDIARTCQDFADAAFFMRQAGYDGVCVHCGHGWLLHQFLSARWNCRTDRFGGSLENRARLSVMVLDAIRERCGADFLLECRVSGDEHLPDGYGIRSMQDYCAILAKHCDLIQVSAGLYEKPMETGMMSTLYDPHGCNVEAASAIKKAVSVPVAVVGGITDPGDAERWIAEGKCDLVVLCRQLMADPDFVAKAAAGRGGQVRRCLRCMRCYPGPYEEAFAELNGEFPEGCSVNPYLLHYDLAGAPLAAHPKKVLVVGGGVAGMQAAITACDRGHRVTLAEKSPVLGGILNFAKDDRDKYDLKALADSMASEIADRDIRVLLNCPASPELMKGFDNVICAVGSSPLLPPIPGLESAIPAMAAYRPDAAVGSSVVMLGGGLVGCETAVHLAKQGIKVTIVEMRGELAPDAYRLHKHKLRQLIAESPLISVLLEAKCLRVTSGGAVVERAGKSETLTADAVVAALGMKANPTSELERMAKDAGAEFCAVGDCVKARKIYDAVEEGFLAAFRLGQDET